MGQKAISAIPRFHSVQAAGKSALTEAVDAMDDIMSKIVEERSISLFVNGEDEKGFSFMVM